MLLRGELLWQDAPEQAAAWKTGEWLIGGEVIFASEQTSCAAQREGYVIPGMVDVHCHLAIGPEGPVDEAEQLRFAQATRDSGVLLVRDCGAPRSQEWLTKRSDLLRLIRCGQHIARPKRYIRGLPVDVEDVAALPEVVAQQAALGDGWVKLVGDWIDRSKGAEADLDPLWPREALIDAVAAAHEAGARVAVHAFSHRAIDDLLEAGVDDIEHGSGMDADQLAQARAQGTLVTPTFLQVELFHEFAAQAGPKYPVYAATMQAMYDNRREHAELMIESGVQLLPGTDAGGYQEHGCLVDELRLWERAGMSVPDIIDTVTWKARRALGVPSLSEGALADFVVYEDDPRQDLSVLARPSAVVLGGVAV